MLKIINRRIKTDLVSLQPICEYCDHKDESQRGRYRMESSIQVKWNKVTSGKVEIFATDDDEEAVKCSTCDDIRIMPREPRGRPYSCTRCRSVLCRICDRTMSFEVYYESHEGNCVPAERSEEERKVIVILFSCCNRSPPYHRQLR